MIVQNVTTGSCTPQTIVIGRRGTHDTMQIAFDLSYLIENYGSGTAVLAVKRSQDESAYPAVVTQEDSTLKWTVNETDTAYVGSGECQLMWYVDGGLAKTIIYPMVVMRDILQTAEEPPDGYENWIESLTALGAETQQNAQNAAQSASDARQSATDARAAKDAANEAVLHYPKIENGYWYVWDVTAQDYQNTNIKAEGEDGYSPEVTITSITGGHRVTITDKDHPHGQSFDVLDGQGGGGGDVTDVQINGTSILEDGVANIPIAGETTPGLVKVKNTYGITQSANHELSLYIAGYNEIKSGSATNVYRPVTASRLDGAAFYGLAKAAGDATQSASANAVGAYTEDAKSAIHEMLNGAVTVSGTTPTIVAKSGITYVCGEVVTLDITPPSSGIFEVQFVSGSTPTVLTATGVTWANGFDPTALEANKTYDISISNGIGVAVWI